MKKLMLLCMVLLMVLCSCNPNSEEMESLDKRIQELEDSLVASEGKVSDSNERIGKLEEEIEGLNLQIETLSSNMRVYPIEINSNKEFIDLMESLRDKGNLYLVEVIDGILHVDEMYKNGIDVSINMSVENFNRTVANGGSIRWVEEGILELNKYVGDTSSSFFQGIHTYVCAEDKLEDAKVYALNNPDITIDEE